MADGSFYEGQFVHGEIQGHGFRRWAATRNEYTGQFVKGELNGHGIMIYGDGSRYEGEWLENQREGKFVVKGCVVCDYTSFKDLPGLLDSRSFKH